MEASIKSAVLLVDDEPKNLFALRELLQDPNLDLVVARSGDEALRRVLEADFALILLDVLMPGLDGFETARLIRVRERSALTPIIFLTAAADEIGSIFRGYEVGAVDYLIKPLVPEVLKSKVAVFVELHRKSAALAREIGERQAAERRLRDSEGQLRALAAHLITVREEERAHIAREIHDELGQVLTGLKMDVAWLAQRLHDPTLLEKTDAMRVLLEATVRTVRKISTGLRPEVLDEMGLVAAIGWQATEFQKRTGIRCHVSLPPPECDGFDRELSTAAFRIFQEILTNAARHSRASRVSVEVNRGDGQLLLDVRDNGVGMPEHRANDRISLGLLGMRERALRLGGSVHVSSKQGQGTSVSVAIPLARP